jgi:hypothetical protein
MTVVRSINSTIADAGRRRGEEISEEELVGRERGWRRRRSRSTRFNVDGVGRLGRLTRQRKGRRGGAAAEMEEHGTAA